MWPGAEWVIVTGRTYSDPEIMTWTQAHRLSRGSLVRHRPVGTI